jgi:hypothetical protein
MKSKCDNCDWTGTPTIGLEEIPDLSQRLDVGSVVPSGECPECGALCYETEEDRKNPSGETWIAKPTAGHERHGQSVVYDEQTGKDIAIVYDGKEHADKIAAAPELLDMLREMVCRFEHNEAPEDLECLDRARAVIAKVKGQQ